MGEALKANSSLTTLIMYDCSLGPEDGKGLAAGVAASASLTKVRAACSPLALCSSDRALVALHSSTSATTAWASLPGAASWAATVRLPSERPLAAERASSSKSEGVKSTHFHSDHSITLWV